MLDNTDHAHISYYDSSAKDLKYAFKDSGGWSIETVDSEGNVGTYTSLQLDSQGNPCISYHEKDFRVKLACKVAGTWKIQVVQEGWRIGSYTSLALDENDLPRISFYNGNSYDLYYAAGRPIWVYYFPLIFR